MKGGHALGAACEMLLLAGLLGCGSGEPVKPPPVTHKVDGTVLRKDGTPFAGAMITFRHVANPEFSANSKIDDAGRFKLMTLAGKQTVEGAQEGEHQVMVLPRGDTQDAVMPMMLTKKYLVKPGDNQITIKLEN